uniref:choice-of-anchor D domain-containing protein n=1 Tax=Crenothrix polyspora TaxID=360316 RepID=UPI0011786513
MTMVSNPSTKHQAPSTKHQAPSTKHQAPSTKHQATGQWRFIVGLLAILIACTVSNTANADLTTGLVAHWSFDDCTATDNSGNGHNGVLSGTANCSSVDSRKVLYFNGATSIRVASSAKLKIDKTITLSAIVNMDAAISNGAGLIEKGASGSFWDYGLVTYSAYPAYRQDNSDYTQDSRPNLSGAYHQLTVIVDEDNTTAPVKLYVDGVLQSGAIKSTNGGNIGSNANFIKQSDNGLLIGVGHPGAVFKGYIDDLRIYNRVLTDAEIATLAGVVVEKPVISVSPTNLLFGQQPVGQATQKTVTLSNTGTGTLDIGALNLNGDADFAFDTNSCNNAHLVKDATCEFTVAFKAGAAGVKSGYIVVPSNAADLQVAFSGEGTAVVLPAASGFMVHIHYKGTPVLPITVSNAQHNPKKDRHSPTTTFDCIPGGRFEMVLQVNDDIIYKQVTGGTGTTSNGTGKWDVKWRGTATLFTFESPDGYQYQGKSYTVKARNAAQGTYVLADSKGNSEIECSPFALKNQPQAMVFKNFGPIHRLFGTPAGPASDIYIKTNGQLAANPTPSAQEILSKSPIFSQEFSPQNAAIGAILAELAYYDDAFVRAFLTTKAGFNKTNVSFFKGKKFIETSSEHYIAQRDGVYYIFARGTKELVADIARDVGFTQTWPLEPLFVYPQNDISIHLGFHGFGQFISANLADVFASKNTPLNSRNVFFAGHSLGGAAVSVASLYATNESAVSGVYATSDKAMVYTFGAPRAFSPSLTKATSPFRFFHTRHIQDPVPNLPPKSSRASPFHYLQNGKIFTLANNPVVIPSIPTITPINSQESTAFQDNCLASLNKCISPEHHNLANYIYSVLRLQKTAEGQAFEKDVQKSLLLKLNTVGTGNTNFTIKSTIASADCPGASGCTLKGSGAGFSFRFAPNAKVTITAVPAAGTKFAGWHPSGGCQSTPTNPRCVVTMFRNHVVSANIRVVF